jgi:ABC-2 type transport system ATP-binding protein
LSSQIDHRVQVAIKADGLNVGVDKLELLQSVNLQLNFGEIVGLAGPNGSGKTLLLKTLIGLIPPLSGSYEVFTTPRRKLSRFNPQIGVCIDGPGYDPELTGLKNVLRLTKIRKIVTVKEISSEMRRLGLDPESKKPMKEYSLGMKQKIDIIQSYVEGQQILLLDEPFNALDATSREVVKSLLKELSAAGRAILVTSHAKEDWIGLVDRSLHISEGKLIAGTDS